MKQSMHAKNTVNPIRKIVDAMAVEPNKEKSLIKLHLGDPTLTGHLPPCPIVTEAMQETVASHRYTVASSLKGSYDAFIRRSC